MKAWSEFFRDVLPDVPGCPDPVLEHALLRAAQDFFSRAHVWTLWLDNTATLPGTAEYDIELERHSELVKIQRATLDGRPIAVTTPESLPTDWQTHPSGIADCVFTRDRKTLSLLPANTAGLLLRVEATLKPSNSAAGIEDHLFDQYVTIIATGAKARLMLKPGVPYSNPALAQLLQTQFDAEIARLEIQRFRAFSTARPRARLKTF